MFGVDAFIIRPFNNYGPRQNYEGLLAGIIPITAWRIINGICPELHGDGQQSRDFIYAPDTVEAVLSLYPIMPSGDSVNVSSDSQTSMSDLLTLICRDMGYSGTIVNKPARAADVLCHNASNAKLHQLIEFSPTPLEIGLKQTLDWYRRTIERSQ
jgi:UDP-glucose 4-epimerase